MKCRICGDDARHPEFKVREMMYGTREVFKYFQCRDCECLQIESFPPDMGRHYSGAYYSYKPVQAERGLTGLVHRLRDGYAVSGEGLVGKLLLERSPVPPPMQSLGRLKLPSDAAILDVGCGSGPLLHALREAGYRNVQGADPFVEADIEYPNGLRILKQDIHQVEGRWDVITFHHSFEHLPDPLETLQSVLLRLKPGGCCILRVPTVTSHAWQYYGVDWVQLDAPRHFFLFSVKSIEVLSRQAGLTLGDIVYDSGPLQFWGSEQYLVDMPLHDERSFGRNPGLSMFGEREIAGFSARADALNKSGQGDQAVFYLHKAS